MGEVDNRNFEAIRVKLEELTSTGYELRKMIVSLQEQTASLFVRVGEAENNSRVARAMAAGRGPST
jgi:hypothetical protein